MKLVIDLNDPEIKKSLEIAIHNKVDALISQTIQTAVESVIEKKTQRMTDKWFDGLAQNILGSKIQKAFQSHSFGQPSEFQIIPRVLTEKIMMETLTGKKE